MKKQEKFTIMLQIDQETKGCVEIACRHAFDYLRTIGVKDWDNTDGSAEDIYYRRQLVSAVFYNIVFKFGSNITGYCELGAEKNGTDDHFLSPRMGCYALMNQRRDLLENKNYDEFAKFYRLLRCTIKIKKDKNDTDEIKFVNDFKTGIIVKNLTVDKYEKIVNKWSYVNGLGKNRTLKHLDEKIGFPLKHLVPEFFTNEEKKYYTPVGNLEKFI